eukprot:CFRG4638T1
MSASRNMFLTRALQKILSEKETKKSHHAKLRSACETALEEIAAEVKALEAQGDDSATTAVNADKYFYTFQQACETESPPIVGTSLDCLQKLIAYGDLTGKTVVHVDQGDGDGEATLMDDIINTICGCYIGPITEADVMLQILKAILTAVTSPNCEVHGQTLLNAIKTCYNIYLSSTSGINITTAKATLTQMLSVVFQRMESHPVELPVSKDIKQVTSQDVRIALQKISVKVSEGVPQGTVDEVIKSDTEKEPSSPYDSDTENYENDEVERLESNSSDGENANDEDALDDAEMSTDTLGDAEKMSTDILGDAEKMPTDDDEKLTNDGLDTENISKDVPDDVENISTSRGLSPSMSAAEDGSDEDVESPSQIAAQLVEDIVDDMEMRRVETAESMDSVNRNKTPDHLRLRAVPSLPHDALAPSHAELENHATKAMLGAMPDSEGVPVVSGDGVVPFSNSEAGSSGGNSTSDKSDKVDMKSRRRSSGKNGEENSVLVDARPAVKGNGDATASANAGAGALDMRSPEARSKVLSLELILLVLQNSGKVFQTHSEFIDLVRKSLCISLSKNGVSPIPQVFELSLAVFLCLLVSFKVHLKAQIEVFFKDIFMLILESPTSSFGHKWMVLNALQRICSNPQTLVDLFLNYDCDLSLDNIFARFVHDVSRISNGRNSTELGGTPQQEEAIKFKGLECMVTMLESMVTWMKKGDEQQANLDSSQLNLPDVKANAPLSAENSALTSSNSSNTALGVSEGLDAQTQSNASGVNLKVPVVEDGGQDFEGKRKTKKVMEECIQLFNKSPKNGLKKAKDAGLVGHTKEDVIKWLQTEERLSKTVIGEMLGDGDKDMIELMYEWVDSIDFKGMDFVEALRHFLSGFRLPGEAQKIDRLMEKFAEQYCNSNPNFEYFANADTAYVLAFSIIMLTTDLHSGRVKNKMTKEEFIRNNRGINDSKDLPLEFLSSVYDEIAAREIKVKDDRSTSKSMHFATAILADEKKRRAVFSAQMTQTSEATQALLVDEAFKSKLDFTIATRVDHIRPMFSLAWTSCLAAFSVPLKISNDTQIVLMCLDGFAHAIRISAQFYMDLERDAFVQSLTQFTNLINTNGNVPRELRWKNRESFRTLLGVATAEGDHLQNSWYPLLKCISVLELVNVTGPSSLNRQNSVFSNAMDYAGMLSSGDNDNTITQTDDTQGFALDRKKSISSSVGVLDNMTFISNMALPESTYATSHEIKMLRTLQASPHGHQQQPIRMKGDFRPGTMLSLSGNPGIFTSASDGGNLSAVHRQSSIVDREQSVLVEVDKIYTGTPRLNGEAILDFVCCLCRISLEELHSANPRMYSLQKIVEISYYNMDRIRLEWSRIWNVLGDHFNKVGCFKKLDVAMFAVDSLRQLAMKFLERPELAHFHFQKDFLKPFEYIMDHNKSPEMRDMVVRCISQMVAAKAQNIRSGWKNVFVVCSAAAGDENSAIVTLAFNTTKSVIKTYTDLFVGTAFVDSINCLVEFACNPNFPSVAMEAIDRINECAERMADEHGYSEEFDDAAWVQGWFPILFGLHSVMARTSLDIRTRALTILFEILKSYGKKFRSDNWKEILFILFRLFDDQKLPDRKHERIAWLNTTCNHALFAIVELFTLYMDQLEPMIGSFYTTLRWCIDQDNEQIARSATQCLQVLVLSNGHLFNTNSWDSTANAINSLFEGSTPKGLVEFNPSLQAQHDREGVPKDSQRQGLNFNSIIIKCVVQLEMIQAVENIVLHESGAGAQAEFNARKETAQRHKDENGKVDATEKQPTEDVVVKSNGLDDRIANSTVEEVNGGDGDKKINVSDTPELGMYRYLNPNQLKIMLNCLRDSHEFAKRFNNDQRLRTSLWKAGFMKQLPNLLKQETTSLHASLGILFRIYDDRKREEMWTNVESRLYQFGNQIMELFVNLQSDKQRAIWSPVLVLILTKVLGFDDERFARHVGQYYSNLSEMMALDMRPELRSILRDVFRRIGNQFFIMSQQASEKANV